MVLLHWWMGHHCFCSIGKFYIEKLRSLVFIQTIPVFKIGAISHSPHLQKTISILFSTRLNRTGPYKLIQIYLVQIYGLSYIYIGIIQWALFMEVLKKNDPWSHRTNRFRKYEFLLHYRSLTCPYPLFNCLHWQLIWQLLVCLFYSVWHAIIFMFPPDTLIIFADVEVPVACVILIGLFALQHYGTHRVGFLFAPVVLIWLFCISGIGIYNIFRWNPHVYKALSPYYMYQFLRKTQTGGWMSLGGILLCITGNHELLMVNFDSIAITSKVVRSFVFLIPTFSFQVLKPCLLILDTFRNYRSRYVI